jgi:hypothetical protein
MGSANQSRVFYLVTGLAVVGAVFVAWWQHHAAQALQAELVEARAQSAEAGQLQAEVDRLRGADAEVKRLREENRELPRLRGEAARLRRELAAATNLSGGSRVPLAAESAQDMPAQTNLTAFTGTARALLAPGQTLVMGGWPLAPGQRALALFTPSKVSEGQPETVLISGMYVQVPGTLLAGPGWEQFQSVTKDANSSSVFDAGQARAFVEALQKLEGVQVLSSPRLMTTSGNAGSISIGQGNGTGLNTTLLAVMSPDGQTVDLTVSNSLRHLPPPPEGGGTR